jgi:hypothetical protein
LTILLTDTMSTSSVRIEAEREELMEKLKSYHDKLCDTQKRLRDCDKLTLQWMLANNVTKLKKLPLPEYAPLVNTQVELCEKLLCLVAPDRVESLERHIQRLRRQLREVGSASSSC